MKVIEFRDDEKGTVDIEIAMILNIQYINSFNIVLKDLSQDDIRYHNTTITVVLKDGNIYRNSTEGIGLIRHLDSIMTKRNFSKTYTNRHELLASTELDFDGLPKRVRDAIIEYYYNRKKLIPDRYQVIANEITPEIFLGLKGVGRKSLHDINKFYMEYGITWWRRKKWNGTNYLG